MTHYTRHYDATDKAQADAQAIADCRDYLSPKHWAYFEETFFAFGGQGHSIGYQAAKKWIQAIRFACVMVGIQGRPVNALCRKFLAQFKG